MSTGGGRTEVEKKEKFFPGTHYSAAAKSSFFSSTQTGLTSFSNHIFLAALGLLYMRNAVDIAESDGELIICMFLTYVVLP